MLNKMASVSLVIIACTTLVPTKANGATLTFIAENDIVKKRPGESITFIVGLKPAPGTPLTSFIKFLGFNTTPDSPQGFKWDRDELQFSRVNLENVNTPIKDSTTIARVTFDVSRGVKQDRMSDFNDVEVKIYNSFFDKEEFIKNSSGIDVIPYSEPVPEPLTIFGTATALGWGTLLKRKSSKKTVS